LSGEFPIYGKFPIYGDFPVYFPISGDFPERPAGSQSVCLPLGLPGVLRRPRRWAPRIVIVIVILTVLGIWSPAQLAMVLGALAAVLAMLPSQERGTSPQESET
jgi:hypothetical protein